MGRFRYVEDDENDENGKNENEVMWQFVGDSGEEGAIVRVGSNRNESIASVSQDLSEPPTYRMILQTHSDSYDYQKRRPSTIPLWIYVAGLAVLVQCGRWLTTRYGPPGPPPESEEPNSVVPWDEFLSSHASQLYNSTMALFVRTPLYVGHWWAMSAAQEIREWWETPAPCQWETPNQHLTERLQDVVLEQPWAVEILADEVLAWNRTSPLVMAMLGGRGTGKRTAAHALAQITLRCPWNRAPVVNFNGDELMTGDLESAQARLGTHFLESPSGIITLIQNVEAMSPQLLSWILTELHGEEGSSWDLKRRHHGILILASESWGQRVIASVARQRTGKAIALSSALRTSALLDLEYELDQSVPRFGDRVSAIVPFFPMSPVGLRLILGAQFDRTGQAYRHKYWRTFQVTKAFLNYVTDPYLSSSIVEYLTYRSQSGEDTTFSTTGAEALAPTAAFWTKIEAQIVRCLATDPTYREVVVLNVEDGRGRFDACQSFEKGCQEICHFTL